MLADLSTRAPAAAAERAAGRWAWLLLPGVALLAVLFVYPVLHIVALAFGPNTGAVDPSAPSGLAAIVTNRYVRKIALTTLKLSFWTTAIAFVLGYPLAYYLVRSTSRQRYLVFMAVLTPLLVSIVVRTLGWIIVLGNDGLLNQLLMALHLEARPAVWLYNFSATVIGLVHVLLPFMVLSIMSALAKVDDRVEESARVLGANRWRTFVYVTLPLSAQGIFSGCVLVFGLAMGSYVTPFLLGGGKVQVLATQVYSEMLEIVDWHTGALLAVYLSGLTLSLFAMSRLLVQRREARDAE